LLQRFLSIKNKTMKTKSGILILTKKEIEALELLRHQTLIDLHYGWGGSYGGHDEDDKTEEKKYNARVAKGKLGVEVIDFVLQITK
jgi:hypothetical protein